MYSFYYNERDNNPNHEPIKKDNNLHGGYNSERHNNSKDITSPRDNYFNKNENTKNMFKTEFAKPLQNVPNLNLDRINDNISELQLNGRSSITIS